MLANVIGGVIARSTALDGMLEAKLGSMPSSTRLHGKKGSAALEEREFLMTANARRVWTLF